ncbi:MAG: MFS transporter [Pigmentiphaga sp.]|nr:MFS transporter [Pigmentiphaga sp.]
MIRSLSRPTPKQAILILGILLIAANLRAPFTGLPPLLGSILADFGLSTTAVGAVTTLPLLAFALLSPWSALLARKYGLERVLFGALAAIALGIVLRSAGAVWSLYAGTWIVGMGIAAGNVLLPSLVKRDFPLRVAALTGAYALAMGVIAALGSALVFPLADVWGWQGALAAFLVLPVAALAAWMPQLRAPRHCVAQAAKTPQGAPIWRSALAWQVTLFLGINSTIYYVVIGWLPIILTDAGLSPSQAGSLHGAMQLATALPGLVLGPILHRMRDQRLPAVVVTVGSALALLGLMLAPQWAFAWTLLFGAGSGSWFILGLTFIGLRTGSAPQAAALSGMAQSIGYLLAAVGPMAMGALYARLGGWKMPLGLCVALTFAASAVGVLAGRNLHIGHALNRAA